MWLILAQAAGTPERARGPSWLDGVVTVPFWAVGVLIGLAVMGGLAYYARKFGRTELERELDQERR
ncbi:MAG: hypothetical protein AAGI01_03255 [Myxococcota bacterium]